MGMFDDLAGSAPPEKKSGIFDDLLNTQNPLREKYKKQIRAAHSGEGVFGSLKENKYEDGVPIHSIASMVRDKALDPFGWRDEVVGGGLYAGSVIGDLAHLRAPDLDKAGREYDSGAERVRAENEIVRERLGWGGDLATSVLGGGGTTMAGKGLARAATFLGRAAQSAKTGAQFGAIAGAGHAEGGIGNRLWEATKGAGYGAAIAPALSEVGFPVGNALYQWAKGAPSAVSSAVKTIIPGTRVNIDERLLRALDRQNMTPAELKAWELRNRDAATFGSGSNATTMNIPYTLADSGPAMQQLGYSVASQPGKGATMARSVLEGRQRGQDGFTGMSERMDEATRRSLRVTRDNAARSEDKLTAGRKTASDKAYDDFRNWDGRIPIDDILNAHANEVAAAVPSTSDVAAAVAKAHNLFADARVMSINPQTGAPLVGKSNHLTSRQFDAAKKSLDDMISTAMRAGENYKAGVLTDLKTSLVQRADAATTVTGSKGPVSLYAAAREAYATPSQLLDAQAAGKEFRSVHPDRIGAEYRALNTPERRQYRIGMADDLGMKYGEAGFGHNVTKHLDTPNMQNRLGEVMGGKNQDKLNSIAKLEADMHATRQRNLYGSRTDENQQWRTDFTLAQRLGGHLREGKVFTAVGDGIASLLQKAYKFREADARLLARDLFATDPAQRMATIQRLEQAHGARQVRSAISESMLLAQQVASRLAVPEAVKYLNAPAQLQALNALGQSLQR